MNKIFLDCGSGHGEGLIKHVEKFKIDEEWKIFCFESNPYTLKHLKKVIKTNKLLKNLSIEVVEKAVWIEDSETQMSLEGVNLDSYKNNKGIKDYLDRLNTEFEKGNSTRFFDVDTPDWGGSSIVNPEFFNKEGLFQDEIGEIKKFVSVKCLDFNQWTVENTNKEDFIVMKMDIEGAEYEVLRKMIKEDSLKRFNELSIEFHLWMMRDKEKISESEKFIRDYIHKNKINLVEWE